MNCYLPEISETVWNENEDIFLIINPRGKVIKADRSNFSIDEKSKDSQVSAQSMNEF